MPEDPVERKLAALLSADVVGYSRLMADDESATIRTLRDYREAVSMLIRQHRGRVVDAPGDNILSEFPTALDAVRCAMEIQAVLRVRNASLPVDRRMEFRIGVHMGDVAVEGERIYGDGVNIAARLEGLAETGGVCISATVHEQVRNKLEAGFTDLGDQTVKNIPDQVRVYRVQGRAAGEDSPAAASKTRESSGRTRLLLVGLAVVVALVGVGLWRIGPSPLGVLIDLTGVTESLENPPLPEKPSIVVLPFANMSGNDSDEYFADGMTEELTADLAGLPLIFVIARNSAFTYKNKPTKVEDIGRELGVRYVLEGSIRTARGRVRVTAQLIDATTGVHIWSKQYDRDLEDIFAVQSEISESILGAVGLEVREAELARIRRRPTDDLSAYEAFMRGYSLLLRFTRKDHEEARGWLEQAIRRDPEYAAALGMIGAIDNVAYNQGWTEDPAVLDRTEALGLRVLELDPSYPGGPMLLAGVALARDRPDQVIAHARKAIELAPNFAPPHGFLAVGLAQSGEPLAALEALRQAGRLDPRVSESALLWSIRAAVLRQAGRTQEAVTLWEKSREANPDLIPPRIELADYYVGEGRLDEARAVVEEVLSVAPHMTVDLAQRVVRRSVGQGEEQAMAMAENLRLAGLP